jgi:uncharacterized cofD-like protein
VVTIGGGGGHFCLLSGLRTLPELALSAVVSMVDSGGSTGRLRNALGILPPGDLLKCLLALSPRSTEVQELLLRRFRGQPRLAGHNAGNMLLAMLARFTGSFPEGVAALAEILEVQGAVLPVTLDRATLVAELEDGGRVFGESAIDLPAAMERARIRDLFLVPHHGARIAAYPPALAAIAAAQWILLGPGDLFTSVLSNLAVPGVAEALKNSGARIVCILNIMTKFGETHGFSAPDFVRHLERRLGRPLDAVIANTRRAPRRILDKYRRQRAEPVRLLRQDPLWRRCRLLEAELLDTRGAVLRHHPAKLAAAIARLMLAPPADAAP